MNTSTKSNLLDMTQRFWQLQRQWNNVSLPEDEEFTVEQANKLLNTIQVNSRTSKKMKLAALKLQQQIIENNYEEVEEDEDDDDDDIEQYEFIFVPEIDYIDGDSA